MDKKESDASKQRVPAPADHVADERDREVVASAEKQHAPVLQWHADAAWMTIRR